jgi:hypothetical protein
MTAKPEVELGSIGRSDLIGPRIGWEDDGTTKILFGVIGLIRCRATRDRQGDVFLRFKLGGVN